MLYALYIALNYLILSSNAPASSDVCVTLTNYFERLKIILIERYRNHLKSLLDVVLNLKFFQNERCK